MQHIMFCQYMIGDSIIHRLDPRTKIIGCLGLILVAGWPHQQIPILLLNIGFISLLMLISCIGVKRILRGLMSLRIFLVLTFLIQLLFTEYGDIIWSWGIINITQEGCFLGTTTFLRLVMLYLAATLLTMTTSPWKLAKGIESLLYPLNYLRIPVDRITMVISITLYFVPLVFTQGGTIIKAQKSRGACFNSGPLALRLKNTLAILIPLLTASLQRAVNLAMAMENRCYSGRRIKSARSNSLHFSRTDWAAMGIVIFILIIPILC